MTEWRIPASPCMFENDTFFFPVPIVGNMESWCRICGDRQQATAPSFGIAPAQTIGSGRKLLDSNILITNDLGGPCLFTAEKYINLPWLLLGLSIDLQAHHVSISSSPEHCAWQPLRRRRTGGASCTDCRYPRGLGQQHSLHKMAPYVPLLRTGRMAQRS